MEEAETVADFMNGFGDHPGDEPLFIRNPAVKFLSQAGCRDQCPISASNAEDEVQPRNGEILTGYEEDKRSGQIFFRKHNSKEQICPVLFSLRVKNIVRDIDRVFDGTVPSGYPAKALSKSPDKSRIR
jgi:hypothetical protein